MAVITRTSKQNNGILSQKPKLPEISGKLSRRSKTAQQKECVWNLVDGDYEGKVLDVSETEDTYGNKGDLLKFDIEGMDKIFCLKAILQYPYASAVFDWYDQYEFTNYNQIVGLLVKFKVKNNGNFSNLIHIDLAENVVND